MQSGRLAAWLLAVTVTLAAAPAHAEPDPAAVSAARELGYAGVEAYEGGDYAAAHDKLERAYAVLQVPTVGLWSGRALLRLGRLVEASERLQEVARLPLPELDRAVHEQAQRDAMTERESLLERMPELVVRVEGARDQEVAVSLDGRPLPSAVLGAVIPVDPGDHTVSGDWAGQRVEQTFHAEERGRGDVTLRFAPATPESPPPPPVTSTPALPDLPPDAGTSETGTSDHGHGAEGGSAWPIVGWATLGLGAVGLGLGVGAGVAALNTDSALDADCVDDRCRPSAGDDVDALNQERALSTVGFVVGAAATAAGITILLLAADDGEPSARAVRARVGLARFTVGGAF